jgi:hypothetical protein
MESPLHVGKDLRLDKFRAVRIEEPTQCFNHCLLLVSYPTLAHQSLQTLGKPVRTFHAKCLHINIIEMNEWGVNAIARV